MSAGSIKGFDLEELREIFKDRRAWVEIGKVLRVEPAEDRSLVRVLVEQYPELDQIVCRMGWGATGKDSGFFQLPQVDDMVLIILEEGSRDQAFVVSRLSSKEDTIPAQVLDGHMVAKALPGKELHLASDTKVLLGKGSPETPPDEPIVLGNVLKTVLEAAFSDRMTEILDAFLQNPVGIGNLGNPVPLSPGITTTLTTTKTAIGADKASFDDFLSELAFSEKGN